MAEKEIQVEVVQPPKVKISPGDALNKGLFTLTLSLLALRVRPQRCKFYLDQFRKVLLNLPRLRNIVSEPHAAPEVCKINSSISAI
jgi:hypothetical protein